MLKRRIAVITVAVIAWLVFSDRVAAQTAGTQIIVAIPADIEVHATCYLEMGEIDLVVPCATPGALYEGSVALVTGKSEGTIPGGFCVTNVGEVHSVVLVDPGGQRAARRTELIAYYAPDGLRPGDRINRYEAYSKCELGGVVYQLFTAFVQ